ncbi:MAG TPA: SgcJ/EcaC family oxidoreductase [Phycisphaerae bacterium]|jgi:uncharacterized protein (TIGR02246 family)|nr:SgcJ/EcaC family oxidoreductase [Phycisphaerae bacterium]HOB75672.1 SgcJ/EcaC family oxidoreductase [Phycisphaerae bacterium]HOJ53284.1 SgcJ/EcaC family oxidoreductase [Phycisphaerae bacterium]HOL27447.1 SgcJ/EcaC family oxidoreductase [Phycisphaerae bacterium]HPP21643.1 SgcJ/EcaC family oxidoreductase [Phycisphaerae bacterium]
MWRFSALGICVAILTCAAADAQDVVDCVQPQPQIVCGPQETGAVVLESVAFREVLADEAATRQPPATRPAADRDTTAVEQALRTYAETFNKHDAAAIATLWSPTGAHEDRDTGHRLEGREAIQADLAALFKKHPGIRISVQTHRVRFIGRDVAKVNGRAMVSVPGEEPLETSFSAIFAREDGRWLLDNVEETASASLAGGGAALKGLAWMVGTWRDQSEDVQVETTTRWSRGGAFLIRSYAIQARDQEPREGTQVIGWDPRSRQIRSWTFESDGSFGEGVWSRSGDEWLVRMIHTSADGEVATATQVINKIDNNRLKTQMVGLEVNGVPLPSMEPVMVARVSTLESPSSDRR